MKRTAKKSPTVDRDDPISLFQKGLHRTPLEDAYVDAFAQVQTLRKTVEEAYDRLHDACESGVPLMAPLPRYSIDDNWHLVDEAAKTERALSRLLEKVRETVRQQTA